MKTALILRPVIRETMRAAPKRRWTPSAMLAALRSIHPDATLDDVSAAFDWNHSKGFVDYTHDGEQEADFWTLTKRGLNAA